MIHRHTRLNLEKPVYGGTAGLWWNSRFMVEQPVYGGTAGLWWNSRSMVEQPVYGGTAGLWWNSRSMVEQLANYGIACWLSNCKLTVESFIEFTATHWRRLTSVCCCTATHTPTADSPKGSPIPDEQCHTNCPMAVVHGVCTLAPNTPLTHVSTTC